MSLQASAKRSAAQANDQPVKRTRVSRACDQCRVAREKCNGAQPFCSTCSASKRACTYTAKVKKRGIQPGYIRALELALAYLFQHDSRNEAVLNDRLAQGGASSLILSRNSKESNKLLKRWRKAKFSTDVDRLLSGNELSGQDQPEPCSSDSDEDKSDTEELPSTTIGDERNLGHLRIQQTLINPAGQPTSSARHTAPLTRARVCLPLESWKLIEDYFTYTQCWFPVCEKHDILKLSYTYSAEGITVSPELPNSGVHAELWSILAVASAHEANDSDTLGLQDQLPLTPAQLYGIARSLIPDELGQFEIGHVKALLNLAIYNIAHSRMQAARLLVSYASHSIDIMDQVVLVTDARHKHVLQGCFVLDSMLTAQHGQRAHFRHVKPLRPEKVDEEGLDEWQPWTGVSHMQHQQSRVPVLALSTFNALVDIVDLLVEEPAHDSIDRLKAWESSLPAKLVYICASVSGKPSAPPGVLLQSTWYCAAFVLTSSQPWLARLLDLLEHAQDQIGWKNLPPVLRCLLHFVIKRSGELTVDAEAFRRLQKLQFATTEARFERDLRTGQMTAQTSTASEDPSSANLHNELASPISHQQASSSSAGSSMHTTFSPLQSTLSRTLPEQTRLPQDPSPRESGPYEPAISDDLESFFDELASLDTANASNNQPQFMQNLGFAPDASMADLFSEYIPLQSSTLMPSEDEKAMNLDSFDFYDPT